MNKRAFHKITAWCLAVLMTLSCVYIGAFAAAPDRAETFTGSLLLAVNTDRSDSYATFSTDRGEMQDKDAAAAQAEKPEMLPDGLLDEPEPLSGAEALLRQSQLGQVEPQAAACYRVGDTRRIYSHYADSEGRDYRTVDMVCTCVSDMVTIWHEQGEEAEGEAYDEKLAAEMDVQLPRMLDFFGDKRIDADGDGKFAVFIYAIDGYNIGGYFTLSDLMDPLGRIGNVWHPLLSTSNHCDCIHVQNHGYSFIRETCLHEYQHYIQASYRFVGHNNFNALKGTETFINEGFSTGAEFLLLGADRYSYGFGDASKPSNGLCFMHWEHDSWNYSMAFVFSQYFRTRYAALTNDLDSDIPGGSIYKRILESRTKQNEKDTLAIVADILYPQADYPDLRDSEARCSQLLVDFWTAVICREPTGVHGFNGESWVDNIKLENMLEPMPAGKTEYPIRGGMAGVYRIPSGAISSVRVTHSDESLRFFTPAVGGYILYYDVNGGTDAPQSGILRESYRISGMPRRSGYTFLGWAKTPDATSASYHTGNTIRLTQDTTLYAVWQASPQVQTDLPCPIVRQSSETCNNYRFVPPADGVYKVAFANSSSLYKDVYDGNTPVEPLYQQARGIASMLYYQLKKGNAYDLQVTWATGLSSAAAFTITRQQQMYTLTYRFDHPLVDWTYTSTCDDTYYVMDYPRRGPLQFYGWARTPSAQTAEFRAGDTITLTQDTTLYAVYAPEVPLPTNGVATTALTFQGKCVYILRPEKDGTYALQWKPENGAADDRYSDASLYDGATRNYMTVPHSVSVMCSLRAGETYYLVAGTDVPTVVASVRQESDRITSSLTLSAGNMAFFDLTLHGKTTYTLPAYTPMAADGREFLQWEDETTSACYQPGDTITVLGDTVLQAKWKRAPQTNAEAVRAVALAGPRLFRTLWLYLFASLRDRIAR